MSAQLTFRQIASTAIIAWLGALLEWIDFYIYVLLALTIAEVFFPKEDPFAAQLGSFAALAVGFLFRPLGAILFGKIGDQFGRKVAFLLAVTCMLAGTLGIGLLPTYSQVGILASIAVFILRIIQGLALGGGFGSAIVYLGETVPEHRRGMLTGFLFTTAPAGIALAGILVTACSGLPGEWYWRAPFIIAGIIVVSVALILHFLYRETPVFAMIKTLRRTTTSPIRELFTNREYLKYVLIAWLGVVGAHGPIWYTNQAISIYYMAWHGVAKDVAKWIVSTATLLALWAYVVFGWLSDKIGRRPILLAGIYLNALLFIPVFYLMKQFCAEQNIYVLFALAYSLTFMNGVGYSGAMSAFLLELFPSRIRLTGVALSYNLGYGITGGLTPFMVKLIGHVLGDYYYGVLIWSVIVPMALGSIYLLKGWETLGTRIWAEFAAIKFAKKPLVVEGNTPIVDVARHLLSSGYRSAVVVGHSIGVVEERGIVKALAAGLSVNDPVSKIAVYTGCVREDDPVPKVLTLMQQYGVRCVPVCNSSGEVVGQIEARELLAETLALRSFARKKVSLRFKLVDIGNQPITIRPDTTVREAIKIMAENNIGFLPIVENGRLVAVFSERDVLKVITQTSNLDVPVISFATKSPITLSCNATVRDAIEVMLKHNIRHIVGVEDCTPKCVVSVRDILKLIG